MVFMFRSEIFFRTTRELEYLFHLSHTARIFFPEFNIRLYDKNSESDFFFLHQNQNIFFSNIGNQNNFLEKKTYPPWKLNGPSLKVRTCIFDLVGAKQICIIQTGSFKGI
jgi:hypothetical protein